MNEDIKKWAYDYAKRNHPGFNTVEEAIEYLGWFFDMYDKLPEKVTLYRILEVVDGKIDKKNLGRHYTDNLENFTLGFLESIGISLSDIEDKRFNIVEILVNKKNINLYETIMNRLHYPYEDEFTLDMKVKPKVVDVKNVRF